MNKCSLLLLLSSAVGCATVPNADRDLFAAIKEDNASEVGRLVATGANVNVKHDQSYDGLPPLAWAGAWGSTKAAELLIARGANVNGGNRYGSTPLHVAAYNQKPAMVALLVRKGGDINARTDNGWTPLHKAMERLAMAPANKTPPAEEVATVVSVVELLLANGAAVDIQGSKVGMPIHVAALTGQKALVQMLIDKRADANARSDDGQTPLYQAAKRDSADVAELLLARRADVNARTKSGYTPLMVSAGNGNPGIAKVLLEHGADVGVRDKDGVTALISACRSLLIRYTLEASTPVADYVRRKLPGLDWASEREMLRHVKGDFSPVAVMLVNRGADPNLAVPGFTPLGAASTVGDRALAEALLAHGAKISDASTGETPLHAAIAERHGDVAELLIDKGADVNARNMSQLTPLHFLGVYMHAPKLAELLIQKGADVNAREQAGHTPLEVAIRAGNAEVAEVLRRHGGK
jgi:ankyrin repeat protein